jgi:hypothetical protein
MVLARPRHQMQCRNVIGTFLPLRQRTSNFQGSCAPMLLPRKLRQLHLESGLVLGCSFWGLFDRHAHERVQTLLKTHRFPERLQAPRRPPPDALGVVVGVVVVRRGGHRWSSPEFVEHELLLGGVQRGAGDGVPGGVDVLPCPALGDEDGYFYAFVFTRDVWKQGERRSWVVGEMTTDGLFDGWIIRACLLMQAGLRG